MVFPERIKVSGAKLYVTFHVYPLTLAFNPTRGVAYEYSSSGWRGRTVAEGHRVLKTFFFFFSNEV